MDTAALNYYIDWLRRLWRNGSDRTSKNNAKMETR